MSVVVFGSINTDLALKVPHLPTPGETVLSEGYDAVAGGKGCNQAVAAAKLGADVRMIGAVGDDAWAAIPMAAMKAANVDTLDVRVVGAPTGLASVMVAADGENAIVVASGANRQVSAEQLVDLGTDDVLVCQMEVPFGETAAALRKARAAGARTLLNLAPFGELPEEARNAVDFWLVNKVEGEALAEQLGDAPTQQGDPVSLTLRLARRLRAAVIMTLGGEGVVAVAADGAAWRLAAPKVGVVDTTGAGDAFVGGFAVALAEGVSMPEALELAVAAGASACTGFGAQAGPKDRDALREILEGIAVRSLAS